MNVIQVLICLDLYLILFNKVLLLPTEVLRFFVVYILRLLIFLICQILFVFF